MSIKEYIEIAQAIVTILAVLVSGIWGYWLFVQNRQRFPRANISLTVTDKKLTENKILIHVKVAISNIGNILLSIIHLETRVQWVIPIPMELGEILTKSESLSGRVPEIEWPMIACRELDFTNGECEIEPNETQEMCFDFLVDSTIQTVAVYCYVKNQKKHNREIGWDSTVLHDVNAEINNDHQIPVTNNLLPETKQITWPSDGFAGNTAT